MTTPTFTGSAAKFRPPTAPAPQAAAPEFTEYDDDRPITPSALFIGESGAGKTYAIGRLLAHGLRVALVAVEPKYQAIKRLLKQHEAPLIDLATLGTTPAERWDQLHRLRDRLAAGGYREHRGKPVDVLAFDGMTELVDLVHLDRKARYSRKDSLPMWEDIAVTAVDYFKALRDASGSGDRPLPIVATCIETTEQIGYETHHVPLMPGRKTMKMLAPQFEVVWRLSTGVGHDGQHEFRVHTVREEGFYAKSPAGLFPKVVAGHGVVDGVVPSDWASPEGNPDVGLMFRALLADPRSPYCGVGGVGSGGG